MTNGENFDTLKDPITRWFFGDSDTNIAEKRIRSFERKEALVSDKEYEVDFSKRISVNSAETLAKSEIKQQTNYMPPPISQKVAARTHGPSKTNVLHIDKPVQDTKIASPAQSSTDIKEPLSIEQEEFKQLFSKLDNPLA